jgi:hypothetical protein
MIIITINSDDNEKVEKEDTLKQEYYMFPGTHRLEIKKKSSSSSSSLSLSYL